MFDAVFPTRRNPSPTTQIPVVDFSQSEEVVVETWRKACLDHGFLYVKNHGIPAEVIDAFMEKQRQFFALPKEAKESIILDGNNRGYTPFLESTLDPQQSKRPDTHEGLYFGREVAPDSEEGKLPLHGPNQWPAEELLPGYRAATWAYYQALTELNRRTLPVLALSLGLERRHFDPLFERAIASLRPLHYSAEAAAPEQGQFSAGAHCDYGCLTFLLTDGTPGLQVYLGDKWHDVPYIPGTLVINLGDMLERWTGGRYRSTMHRVVNTSGRERFSAAFFVEPNFETVVEVFPQEGGTKYEPIQCGEYILEKYRTTYSVKTAAAAEQAIAA
ncbi:hypothetical protein QBZ16_002875 [Prototheca wickerhamii]|uniref:Fe2OG dioxygenase domain-containing protein n=1 Tax=Prototheca wickerhamii TaxID=3111 RepID=A0AAD9MHW2_PROWI|nr:hypothetical protein QBZ16_002875 [Prototheca wickerhamii]